MTVDALDPVGIYFGTRSGQVFGSHDEGKTWQKILEGLPSVVCIRNAFVEDGSGSSGLTVTKPAPASSAKSSSKSRTRRTKR